MCTEEIYDESVDEQENEEQETSQSEENESEDILFDGETEEEPTSTNEEDQSNSSENGTNTSSNGEQKTKSNISFKGAGGCYKCACKRFEGLDDICNNCYHNYNDHC